jgi:hypothetical protein
MARSVPVARFAALARDPVKLILGPLRRRQTSPANPEANWIMVPGSGSGSVEPLSWYLAQRVARSGLRLLLDRTRSRNARMSLASVGGSYPESGASDCPWPRQFADHPGLLWPPFQGDEREHDAPPDDAYPWKQEWPRCGARDGHGWLNRLETTLGRSNSALGCLHLEIDDGCAAVGAVCSAGLGS